MIINQPGKILKTGLRLNNNVTTTLFTIIFNINDINRPNISIIDTKCAEGSWGEYFISQANTKQILQIKATRLKNNKFRI